MNQKGKEVFIKIIEIELGYEWLNRAENKNIKEYISKLTKNELKEIIFSMPFSYRFKLVRDIIVILIKRKCINILKRVRV